MTMLLPVKMNISFKNLMLEKGCLMNWGMETILSRGSTKKYVYLPKTQHSHKLKTQIMVK